MTGWGCLSRSQLCVDLLMVVVSIVLVAAFGVLARRHLAAGRIWRGRGMIAALMASGATAVLWGTCSILGVPPFFIGVTRLPPCDGIPAMVRDRNADGYTHAPSPPVDARDGLTPS